MKSKPRTLYIYVLLVVATLAVFAQVLTFPFVALDDPQLVTQNPRVQEGLTVEGIGWAFTAGEHARHARPLVWLSLMLDSQLYGTWTGGFHLTNLLLHVCNTLLLFGLMRRMTDATGRCALVAALFALHPLAVEPVVWVTGRAYVLSTLFIFLMLWSYVSFAQRGGIGRYLLTVLFLALGLMVKPSMVTLPLALLLLDYWPLQRIRFTRSGDDPAKVKNDRGVPIRSIGVVLIEKVPLLALSAVTSVVTYIMFRSGKTGSVEPIALHLRAANAVVSYIRYIGKMFWPSDLAVMYPHPNLHGGTPWQTWQIAGSVILLVAITVLMITALRHRYLIVGWFWFLGNLVPSIGIVQADNHPIADRYAYVPLIGLFIIIAWGGAAIIRFLCRANLRAQWIAGLVATLAVVACGIVSRQQAQLWADSRKLIEHTLQLNPRQPVLPNNLGVFFHNRGRPGDLNQAIANYRKALEIKPDYAQAHFNLARALIEKQKHKEAIEHVQLALQYDPKYVPAYVGLGSAYLASNQLDKAQAALSKALELEPNHVQARVKLGWLLGRLGRVDDAMSLFHQALELSPQHSEAHYCLGVTLQMKGRGREAIDHYRQALASNPNRAEAHNNLGLLLGGEAAKKHYRKAISINPNYFEARLNLANAMAAQGALDEAIDHYQQAIKLAPGSAQVHYGLGLTLVARGRARTGMDHLRNALELNRKWYLPYTALAQELATSPDAALRDPQEAIRLGREAARLTQQRAPQVLETLAAAYASAGQFEGAVTSARQALELARQAKNAGLEKRIAEQLSAYMQAKPYMEVQGTTERAP